MFLNNCSLRIEGGSELPGGYVELAHGKTYKLNLRNHYYNRRCDAEVFIDGKSLGTWRINANETIVLERPATENGLFTFYMLGTPEADAAQLDKISAEQQGLIQVKFNLEKIPEIKFTYTNIFSTGNMGSMIGPTNSGDVICSSKGDSISLDSYCCSTANHSAGATGLSGYSNQSFGSTNSLTEYDWNFSTTISLRLIGKKQVRPLQSRYSTVTPSHLQ